MKSYHNLSKKWLGGLFAALPGLLSINAAHAQIFVGDNSYVTEDTLSGASTSTGFNGLNGPTSVAVAGSDVFVSDYTGGSVHEYDTSGNQISNGGLVRGLRTPTSIALSGSDLFIDTGDNGIYEYTTLGIPVGNGPLVVPGLNNPNYYSPTIAVTASDIYVANFLGSANGTNTISEYTISGTLVTNSLITGLSAPTGIAISGSDIFVTDENNGTVGEYTLSGTPVNSSLITGLYNPQGIAVAGSDIFVTNANNTVGEYTLSGGVVNSNLITTGLSSPHSILVIGLNSAPATVTPASTTTTISSGDSYSAVTPVTSTGGLGTTVSIIAGTASSTKPVVLTATNLGQSFAGLASDVVNISGNDGDVFVPQLTFDLNAANQNGGSAAMTLLYEVPGTSRWENAVLGDHDANVATLAEQDYQGSFASFETAFGANAANLSLYLGAYGVDTTNDTVWAVIDHNSAFGTGSETDLPEEIPATPEPSTWAMLLGGLGLLAFWRTRRHRAQI